MANGEWGNYDYVLKIDEPGFTSDTVYGITYQKNVEKVHCNDCFPSNSAGDADAVTYSNLGYYHKGKALHDGDTILVLK